MIVADVLKRLLLLKLLLLLLHRLEHFEHLLELVSLCFHDQALLLVLLFFSLQVLGNELLVVKVAFQLSDPVHQLSVRFIGYLLCSFRLIQLLDRL